MDQESTRYLSVGEFARTFDMSAKTVSMWIRQGKVAAVQPGGPGGKYRIPATEVDRIRGAAA